MPNDGASIGSVYVDVLPNDQGFWSRFVQANRAQASRAGDDLGAPIGRAISDAIAKGIRDGISTNARADAARSGEQSGAAFATAFRQRVEATLRNLPDVKVGLDTSQVNRDIAELRTQLERLRDRNLTVKVDVTQAYVDVVTLREELASLGRQRPTVRADVDTTAAMAQISALIAEVEAFGRLHPTVRPDVDDSGVRSVGAAARDASNGVSLLVATGVALGPALVPGAAAGAAAIAGILPMALGAAGGIGVLVLAVSGVIGAVKAMSAADDQAAQSSKSLASNQLQMAGAADAVKSAQASLANTVASAADSQRRASEAISNAELSEADAHRQLLQAQQAVTQARIDAARAAEDLQSRVAHNALDQRQAALDTAKAEQSLAAARANAAQQPGSPAAKQTLAEAQLAYDQQIQRNKDLQVEQKRLADDKAKSDKAGIDGSTQVVAALDRVRQATEQVHRAEQATADARAAYAQQARQSAFSIAQAQQAVVNAQRQVQAATVSSATAGGAAMQKLQQQMADLSPAGQQFATFIYSLRNPLLDLRRTAETGLLPGVQTAIQTVLTQMPRANDYVRRFSTELGSLAVAGARAFTGPYWTNWADLMVSKAIPAMDTGARISYNFALGIAGLVKAALPLGEGFGSGLLSFSERFATYANRLENTQGYRQFLDYVRVQGPIVAHTIGEVVQAAVRLVEAISPLGGTSLTIIRLLAETINALPVPVLTTLAAVIGGVVVATKAWGLANDVLKSSFAGGVMDVFNSAVQNARLNMSLAEGQTGRFGIALQGLKGAGQGAWSAISSLAAGIGPGGALAIGVGVAVIGFGILAQKMAEQKAKTDAAIASYERFGDAVAKARAEGQPDPTADLIKHDKDLQDLILHANQYGVSAKSVVDALSGQRNAFTDVNTALAAHRAELVKTIQEHTVQGSKGQRVMDDTALKAKAEVDRLDELAGRFGKVASDQADATDAANLYNKATGESSNSEQNFAATVASVRNALASTNLTADQFHTAITAIGNITADAAGKADILAIASDRVATSNLSASEKASAYRDVLDGLGAASQTQGPTFEALSRTFGNIATSELSARDKADLLKQSLQLLYGAAIDQDHAQETLVTTQASLSTQLQQNSLGFDLKTAKTLADKEAIVQNRQALEAALQATRDKYVADVAAAAGQQDEAEKVAAARVEHDKQTQAILAQIDPTYRNSAAVQDLVTHFGQIPATKSTQVSTPGLDGAIEKLVEAHVINLGLSKNPIWTKDIIDSQIKLELAAIQGRQISFADKLAAGGEVGGWSPHPKADNIPAMLTAGEWVHPVAAVSYYGPGVMEAIRTRAIPRELFGMPRFADGGEVSRWPVTIPLSFTPPNIDALWKQWQNTYNLETGVGGGDLGAWIAAAVRWTGVPDYWASRLRVGIMRESGGNPRAINLWDINAQHGDPSRGLMQTIGATFNRYRDPRLPADIYDPVSNIVAGINYIKSRYGDILNVQQFNPALPPMGYDSGGDLPPGLTLAYNGTGKPESVFTEGQLAELKASGGTTITVPVYGSDGQSVYELAKAVAAELAWQMK